MFGAQPTLSGFGFQQQQVPQPAPQPEDTETTAVLKNFRDVVTPSAVDNKFVAHFYNKFDPSIPADLKKQMQKGIPFEVSSSDAEGKVVQCKPSIQSWIESI